MFHVYLSLLLYVSLARTMSSPSPSRTPQFPSTLSYCTSLRLLRSRTRLPLRRIRSLVYILRVLVTVDLRTNITYFSSRLYLRFLGTLGPSGSAPAVFVSSALELALPARVLVWAVNSYPPDLTFRLPLGTSGSGRI